MRIIKKIIFAVIMLITVNFLTAQTAGDIRDSLVSLEQGNQLNIQDLDGLSTIFRTQTNFDTGLDGMAKWFNNSTSTVQYDAANQEVDVLNRAARYVPFADYAIIGKTYTLTVDIQFGTATSVDIIPAWGQSAKKTVTQSGTTTFTFVAQPQSATITLRGITFISSLANDTYSIDNLTITETDDDAFVFTGDKVNQLIENVENQIKPNPVVRFAYDYKDGNAGAVGTFQGGVTFSVANEQLTVTTAPGGNKIATFGNQVDTIGNILVYVDVESITAPFIFRSSWGEPTPGYIVSTPGKHYFMLERTENYSHPSLGKLLMVAADNSAASVARTIVINEFRVEEFPVFLSEIEIYDPNVSTVEIGGATNLQGGGVAIGNGALVNVKHWAGTEGLGLNGQMAIGQGAQTQKSRNTAVGANSTVVGQSSTSIGQGATAWGVHQFAGGRGATAGLYFKEGDDAIWSARGTGGISDGSPGVVFDAGNIYLHNGWAHLLPPSPSEVGVKGFSKNSDGTIQYRVPSIHRVSIHGLDAHDARFPKWNAVTSYADTTAIVWFEKKIYRNIEIGNIGNQPDTSANWEYLYDDTRYGYGGVPYTGPAELAHPDGITFYGGYRGSGGDGKAYNVAGGDVEIIAGRGTNNAPDGAVRLKVAPPDGMADVNEKNAAIDALIVNGDEVYPSGTYVEVNNLSTGKLERIMIINNDKHGTKGIIKHKFLYTE